MPLRLMVWFLHVTKVIATFYLALWRCWWQILPIQNDARNQKKDWHKGAHLRVLSKSHPMNTNMTGFKWFSKIFAQMVFKSLCILVLWAKVASALEGLEYSSEIGCPEVQVLPFTAFMRSSLVRRERQSEQQVDRR